MAPTGLRCILAVLTVAIAFPPIRGADPELIAFRVTGADQLEIDPQGDLLIKLGADHIRQKKPIIYQVDHGRREEIPGLIDEIPVLAVRPDFDYRGGVVALLCDRVLIFARGELVRELVEDEVTKERITEQCLRSGQAG